jgi:quercetin dioxygenase-like cupin family protein
VIVIRPGDANPVPATGEVFFGDITALRYLSDQRVQWSRVTRVSFTDGAGTNLHVHDFDQLLLIVDGAGLVSSAGGKPIEVGPGDVIFTPAFEPHSHGAAPHADMTHFVVMGDGYTRPA